MVASTNRSAIEAERERRIASAMRMLEREVARAEANGEHRQARIFTHAATQLLEHDNPDFFKTIARMNKLPVTIDEFVHSPEFLGDQVSLWPALQQDLYDMNPDILAGEPQVNEGLLGGSTVTAQILSGTTRQGAVFLMLAKTNLHLVF